MRLQISRIRAIVAALIAREGIDLDAQDIIRSEETSTRAVRYEIDAEVNWEHCRQGMLRDVRPGIYRRCATFVDPFRDERTTMTSSRTDDSW